MKKNVYLVGCRAVGKTSIGKKLARLLGYTFLDTDAMIVESRGHTVAEIVEKEGWHGFRRLEEKILLGLRSRQGIVVATGGGAVLHTGCWSALREEGVVVWLSADLEVLRSRIMSDVNSETQRPSLTGGRIDDELALVLSERTPLYRALAHICIDSGELDVDQAVAVIMESISRDLAA